MIIKLQLKSDPGARPNYQKIDDPERTSKTQQTASEASYIYDTTVQYINHEVEAEVVIAVDWQLVTKPNQGNFFSSVEAWIQG